MQLLKTVQNGIGNFLVSLTPALATGSDIPLPVHLEKQDKTFA